MSGHIATNMMFKSKNSFHDSNNVNYTLPIQNKRKLYITLMNNIITSSLTQKRLEIIGNMIKAARLERKISQQELGERIGVSRPTISAIEKGKANVAIGSVFEAAYIVGLSIMEDENQTIESSSQTIANILKILPSRGRGKKVELDNDF